MEPIDHAAADAHVGQTEPHSSKASDEHIFSAIVRKRLPGEATVERFQLETGSV